ncbi:MAG: hydrolase [Planctomycetes bacterium]|nr:hydrolase [Planctomycetota bacterium]
MLAAASLAYLLLAGDWPISRALAQASPAEPTRSQHAGNGRARLSADKAVLLLVDHQTGLLSLVQDYGPDEFKNNVLALAATGKLFKLPTILTTSAEAGPNGPLLPELRQVFPEAPYIARPGQINAWDNEDFVKAVKATGRKQIVIAGVVTGVCVAFPVLSALDEGFEVFVVADASGTFNAAVRDAAITRMAHAGAIITNWFAVACELKRDWRSGDGPGPLAELFGNHIPAYKNLIVSHQAQAKKP